MIETIRVGKIPWKDLKVRDLFKSRNRDTDVSLDGDEHVLRLTKKKGKKSPSFAFSKL